MAAKAKPVDWSCWTWRSFSFTLRWSPPWLPTEHGHVCMFLCISVCLCLCIHIHIHIHIYIYIFIYIYINVYYIYICHTNMYIMYVHMYTCKRIVYVHVYAVGPKTVRLVVPISSSYVDTQSYHHRHFITQSSCHHHAISNLRISSYVHRDTQGGYGGGGWVGGMITFSTTYIMPLYHHHHIITQSSCHHHAISNLRISSYVDRDTRGVGGGVNNMYIRMWQWRHWHSSQHASLLTLKRNE